MLFVLAALLTGNSFAQTTVPTEVLEKGVEAGKYVKLSKGDDVLYKSKDETDTIASATEALIATPLGFRKGSDLIIVGNLGEHTVPWVVQFLRKNPGAAGPVEGCDLKLSDEARTRIDEETTPLFKDEKLSRSSIEITANALCKGGIKKIVLHTPGGSVAAGMILGHAVKLAGIDTATPEGGTCASACNEIFRQGKRRTMSKHSTLMFHLPSKEGVTFDILPPSRMQLPPSLKKEVRAGKSIFISEKVATDLGLADGPKNAPKKNPIKHFKWFCENSDGKTTNEKCSNLANEKLRLCGFEKFERSDTKETYCKTNADGTRWSCTAEAKNCYLTRDDVCPTGDKDLTSEGGHQLTNDPIFKTKKICLIGDSAAPTQSGPSKTPAAISAD